MIIFCRVIITMKFQTFVILVNELFDVLKKAYEIDLNAVLKLFIGLEIDVRAKSLSI